METNLADLLGPVLENSKVAITVVDSQGCLTLFNRAAELLTGFSRDEVLGHPLSLFYESSEDLERITSALIQEGKVEDYETTVKSKDGRRIPVSILVTALYGPAGSFMGSIGITVDISERKRLEEEVLLQKQRVSFYNDLLCHDILNFCQASTGFLELLDEDGLTDQQRTILSLCKR